VKRTIQSGGLFFEGSGKFCEKQTGIFVLAYNMSLRWSFGLLFPILLTSGTAGARNAIFLGYGYNSDLSLEFSCDPVLLEST